MMYFPYFYVLHWNYDSYLMLHDRHYSDITQTKTQKLKKHRRHQMMKVPNYLRRDSVLPHEEQRLALGSRNM